MKNIILKKFAEVFGDAEGAKVYFAPGRVNLIGEHTDYNGGLSYLEFRSVHNLKNDRYENMSEIALRTLNNKVLPRLEDEARNQAELWKGKMEEIEKVCELREITLKR